MKSDKPTRNALLQQDNMETRTLLSNNKEA